MNKPNILFVMFDQMAALSLPAYGHRLARTPHLDRLAKAGSVFENAICVSPLCSPSRFALMSGCLPSRIGAFDNAAEFPSSIPTLPHYLRAVGYRTCLSGKMDFTGADQLHGFEERLTTDLSPSDFGWVPNWNEPDLVQPWYHTLDSVAEAGPCDYSLSMQYDEDTLFKAEQWLHQAAGAPDGRPFMLTVSFMHPHDPYQSPRAFWDAYEGIDIDMPALPGRSPAERDTFGRHMYQLYDRGEVRVSDAHIRNARRAYYGMLSYADDLLGRLLRRLDLLGLADNTLIVVTSDHGDMLGERGLWYKMVFFEHAIRVPLIVAGPGLRQGQRISTAVSHMDLLPTLMQLADDAFTPVSGIDGRSLVAALRKGEEPEDEVVGEYMGEGYDQPLVMIRRHGRKFIWSRKLGATLYDLVADPAEESNLAETKGAAQEIAALTEEAERRWDMAAIHAAVLDSQRRRRFIHGALIRGRISPWDFEPRQDAANLYYRNYGQDRPDPDRALRLPKSGS